MLNLLTTSSRESAPRWLLGLLTALVVAFTGSSQAAVLSFEVDLAPVGHASTAEVDRHHSVLAVVPYGHRVVTARAVLIEGGPGVQGHELAITASATAGYAGYQLAALAVDLGQEIPDRGPAGVLRARLEIQTAPGGEPALQRLRPNQERDERLRSQLQRRVANPGDLVAFAPPAPVPAAGQQKSSSPGFRPSFDPSLDGSGVEYLIVTTAELQPIFQRLADWKTRRGLPTQVRTLEWIESRTRKGIDRAETLRNFLIEAYQLWGVEWVLLGGDSEIIPARYGRTTLYVGTPDEFLPTDMYYSCLDGTWNGDGDEFWGEGGANAEDPGEADIFPELYLGRAPVDDVDEATLFVHKVMGYETPVFTDYQQNALFVHEVLVPANWDSGMAISWDGATTGNNIIDYNWSPDMIPNRLYDSYWLHPGSSKLSKSAAISQMNLGPGIVNHLGHGYRYNMSLGDASLVNSDAEGLNNGDRSFLLFLANCTAVAFDYECLGERYLLNPNGGASAVIGAARSVSAIYVTFYNVEFFRQFFEFGQTTVGQLLNSTRLARSGGAVLDGQDRHLHFSLNALADPSMRIFTAPVKTTALQYTDSLSVGVNALSLTVTADGQPVEGATVCASKGDEVYGVATTGALGQAALEVTPQTPGMLYLTVTGPNITTLQDSVEVWSSAPANLRIAHIVVDDDTTGSSFGNADGHVDAGETIELLLELENTGGSLTTGITGTLLSNDPQLVVQQDSVALDSLGAGQQRSVASTLVLHVLPDAVDGKALDFTLQLADTSGGSWSEAGHLSVAAPRLEVTQVVSQQVAKATARQATTSNMQIQVELKNYGSGDLPPVTATLSSADSVTIVQGSATLNGLASLATTTLSPPFEIGTAAGIGAGVQLQLEDSWGRITVLDIDLDPPTAPSAPTADPSISAGVMRLVWTPSSDADLLGYHVFRAPLGGAFERLTPDIIWHGDYRDATVAANSKYQYYTVAVDSSLLWSSPSDTLQVTTTPALLDGWPLELSEQTQTSLAIGDLDGDDDLELVVGAIGVYAWHESGIEVFDGDGIAGTFGILSSAPGSMLASVALANLDSLPGLEVVAASWFSNRVHVFDAQGQSLPGWPQQPANGGSQGFWASPALADIEGDGQLEVVIISKDGWLYAWHADGSPLVPATDGKVAFVGGWTQNTPALADLTQDGELEIIVGTALGNVQVLAKDGSLLPGWPRALGNIPRCSPVVGDVDDDGALEIVITSQNDKLHVFRVDGTELPGFPVSAPSRSPDFGPSVALGDLNDDGKLEMVVPTIPSFFPDSQLRVYDYQGNILLSKPLGNYTLSSPILADLDGNGSIDIVQGTEDGLLYAWDPSGVDVDGFPIPIGDYVRGTPTYTDFDQDGLADLTFAGWNRQVYVWTLASPYNPQRAPWPTFHGNHARTGVLARDPTTATMAPVLPRKLTAQWAPNPFNPRVTLRLEIPATRTRTLVRVDLFDARGRLVRRLMEGALPPGPTQLLWDGRDAEGRALGSGIYLYRVQAAGQDLSGKITLVR